MGELARKRCDFTRKAILLEYRAMMQGRKQGYHIAMGRAKMPKNTPGQHPRSTHIRGLAFHLIIYDLEFNWMHEVDPVREKEIFEELHDHWEFLGGAPRIDGDLNHFSVEHNGVR